MLKGTQRLGDVKPYCYVNPSLPHLTSYMHLLQMSSQTDLSLEEFEQENYNFEDLEAIASNENKIKFLEVLSSSQQLVEWLKMETNGTRS